MQSTKFRIINNIIKRGFLFILLIPTLVISFIFDGVGILFLEISKKLDKATSKSIQKVANLIGYYDIR